MLNFLESLKPTPTYGIIKPLILRFELLSWNRRKRLPPTPQVIKHRIVRDIAKKYNINTLVETGTYLGNMIDANKSYFDRIYSIELDSQLFARARRKFIKFKHIHVIKADSSKALPRVLKRINQPAIFWLDAHYSGKLTAKGKINTPILMELKSIFVNKSKKHVILIDDANYFTGKDGYPTTKMLREFILQEYSRHKFKIKHNIIYVYPTQLPS